MRYRKLKSMCSWGITELNIKSFEINQVRTYFHCYDRIFAVEKLLQIDNYCKVSRIKNEAMFIT